MFFNRIVFLSHILLIYFCSTTMSQMNFYEPFDLDTVRWSINDFGRMWTFDNVPLDDFEKTYDFNPTNKWLDDVQRSALQFGGGCSAAFVSEDGLIMTNHHCARNQLSKIQREGEDLLKDGFYAESLEEERKIGSLFVDQLVKIVDVTAEIKNHMLKGETDDEKVKLRSEIKDSLVKKYNKETGLLCRIVTLYHGGKYSLYGYKRYSDIRLVMAPDFQIAATGWDWDNFTYPRYELDFMFYRAYDENGVPVKSDSYYRWSKNGAQEGEPIFVVGRPGSTDRLYTYEHLEYLRDHVYPLYLLGYNAIYYAYYDYYHKNPEKENILKRVMDWGNSRKSFAGRLAGLKNEFIMKKKKDFQEDLVNKVYRDPDLKNRYGHLWNSIDSVLSKLSEYSKKRTLVRFYRRIRPVYYNLAEKMIKIADQKKLPDMERDQDFQEANLLATIDNLFSEEIDNELNDELFKASLKFVKSISQSSNPFDNYISDYTNLNKTITELKKMSQITSKKGFIEISEIDPERILNMDDPFIRYVVWINDISSEISYEVKKLTNSLSLLNEMLGEVIYHVYGDKIPPDATSTIRISDGVIKGYEYNGTIAPSKTTFYGLWDRYESFNKKTYPWGLHERWRIPPVELDLSIDIGFASTNDIVGGNSGSSVININREVVGLVHDGNIESLAGHTIFLEENNRTVATDSQGLIESLKYIYKTETLVKELLNGKLLLD